MREDSLRAHNCRAHESGVSAAHHNQRDTPDEPQKTHLRHTAGARTRDLTPPTRPFTQFFAERPKARATDHDEFIVASEDAVILEPTGDR
ncbi:hypothetical protein HALLA_00310 (plasmid) [Halostagnicola larsenii XH-48]|uniref:Uncharacterized protein n=1 Tax=Halostagnicola larsenii XH-48 TaxID=797299 RepID=W0JSX9_9EURY|nr:hypothetical protein HALLA_00310 [Halostagnicola larsenii XH-48]